MAIEKDKETAKQIAEKLRSFTLTILRVVNEEGTLYDGVNAAEVFSALKKEGFAIEPESVLLAEPIKKVGTYETEVDLGYEIKAKLKVEVKKEE